jgi:Leucine-rich repeat (LRR) protein
LDLSDNRVSDVSPLKDLVGLTNLSLIDNQVSDISALRHLTNLTRLELSYNQVIDISTIGYLINLTYLSLDGNPISDFSPLKYLKNLTDIYLSDNKNTRLPPEIDHLHATIHMVGKDGQLVKIKTRKGSHKKKVHSETFKAAALPFLFVVLIASGIVISTGFKTSKKYKRLFEHGIRGVAEVTYKEESQGSRGGKNYYIHYSYNDNNNNTYGALKHSHDYGEWAKIKIGQKISITYDGSDPQIHLPFIVKESMIYKPLYDSIKFAVVSIGIVLGFLIIVYILIKRRR